MTDYTSMKGPDLVKAYNEMVETAGLMGLEITQVKKFKDIKIGVERCQKLEERLAKRTPAGELIEQPGPAEAEKEESDVSTTKKKTGAKKGGAKKTAVKKAAVAKEPKLKFGHDLVISEVSEENPRHKGTEAHRLYAAMERYMSNNPKATVAEVIEKTDYRRQDFVADKDRGNIKVTKA